jgi:hypothetical protein
MLLPSFRHLVAHMFLVLTNLAETCFPGLCMGLGIQLLWVWELLGLPLWLGW